MPPDTVVIGVDDHGVMWAVHRGSGDVFLKNPGKHDWKFGASAKVWHSRGREQVFGTQHLAVRAAELEARAPALAKQRKAESSTLKSLWGSTPPPPVDPKIHSDPQLDAVMSARKPKPGRWENIRKAARKWRDETKEFLGHNERVRDIPVFHNNLRLRQQDYFDAVDTADTHIQHVLEPLRHSETHRELFAKIVGLQDMVERSQRSVGSSEEIGVAIRQLHRLQGQLHTATGPEFNRLTGKIARIDGELTRLLEPQPQPLGRNTAELQRSLDELMQRATPEIHAALDRHQKLMWDYAIEGVRRRQLPPEVLTRGHYYPHHVIDSANAIGDLLPGVPKELRQPYRGWTQRAEGSKKLIDFDYESTMQGHLWRTEMMNKMDDFAATNLPLLDQLKALEADPKAFEDVFGETDGSVPEVHDLKHGRGYMHNGEEYVVYRYRRHAFPVSPKTKLHAQVMNAALQPFEHTYFIPARAAKYLSEHSWADEGAFFKEALDRRIQWWKAAQITSGGVGTRVVNSFGDAYQLYLEDLPALFNTLRIPSISKILFADDARLNPEQRKLRELLHAHRVTEGSTFYGPQARRTAAKLRRAGTTGERVQTRLRSPVDMLNAVAAAAEAWPRVAKALTDYHRIQKGKSLRSKVFNIEGLPPEAQLGLLGRNVMVDYQAVSPAYQKTLRQLHMPFITWFHRTFGYTGRYLKNNKIEAAIKLGVPYTAMWLWNNVVQGDAEEYVSDWVKEFPMHLTYADRDDPSKNHVVIFPTGADTFMDVFQVPQFMERVGRYARGEEQDLLNFGWTTPVRTLLSVGQTMYNKAIDLTPLLQIYHNLGANRDMRTGQQIVPDYAMSTPDEALKFQMMYAAGKVIPFLDRIMGYMKKDQRGGEPTLAEDIFGPATTVPGRIAQSFLPRWFDPVRGMHYDMEKDEVKKMTREADVYQGMRDLARHDFEDALAMEMMGTPGSVARWFEEHPGQVPDWETAQTGAMARMFEKMHEQAGTPEQRKSTREMMDIIQKRRTLDRFKRLAPSVRGRALIDETFEKRGIAPDRPERGGLFGDRIE